MAYPNVIALKYLRTTGSVAPEFSKKARHYTHLGYQRMLSFQNEGGGFGWWKGSGTNPWLTAYALQVFSHMDDVIAVDGKLIRRLQRVLVRKQKSDGSWTMEEGENTPLLTAHIATALVESGYAGKEVKKALKWLKEQSPTLKDTSTLAQIAYLYTVADGKKKELQRIVERLKARAVERGDRVFWKSRVHPFTRSYGFTAYMETTALVVPSLIKASEFNLARQALGYILDNGKENGTWGSTRATVLALKALVAANLGGSKKGEVTLMANGKKVKKWKFNRENWDVLRSLEIPRELLKEKNRLELKESDSLNLTYQIYRLHYEKEKAGRPLYQVDWNLPSSPQKKGQSFSFKVDVKNQSGKEAFMVMVEVPIPAGCRLDEVELKELVKKGKIQNYDLHPQRAVLYVERLKKGEKWKWKGQFRSLERARLKVPGVVVYEYYAPDRQNRSRPQKLVIR